MVESIVILLNDNLVGGLMYTDVNIKKKSCNGKDVYDVYIYLDDEFIFGAYDKKEIIKQGDELLIYNF